ncbi:MAG: T9SS type A sorting domain-containing protein [Dysgonamonadaceae bacterium]|jgi:hypothetical protein|nr:T9SS type A sorting domain-containing protein [Dysgonamonadaceae bacterium]
MKTKNFTLIALVMFLMNVPIALCAQDDGYVSGYVTAVFSAYKVYSSDKQTEPLQGYVIHIEDTDKDVYTLASSPLNDMFDFFGEEGLRIPYTAGDCRLLYLSKIAGYDSFTAKQLSAYKIRFRYAPIADEVFYIGGTGICTDIGYNTFVPLSSIPEVAVLTKPFRSDITHEWKLETIDGVAVDEYGRHYHFPQTGLTLSFHSNRVVEWINGHYYKTCHYNAENGAIDFAGIFRESCTTDFTGEDVVAEFLKNAKTYSISSDYNTLTITGIDPNGKDLDFVFSRICKDNPQEPEPHHAPATTDIVDLNQSEAIIYPSIADTRLNVRSSVSYRIFGLQGAMSLSGHASESQSIDVSTLKSGIYLISTVDEATGERRTEKFVKE